LSNFNITKSQGALHKNPFYLLRDLIWRVNHFCRKPCLHILVMCWFLYTIGCVSAAKNISYVSVCLLDWTTVFTVRSKGRQLTASSHESDVWNNSMSGMDHQVKHSHAPVSMRAYECFLCFFAFRYLNKQIASVHQKLV